MRVKAPLCCFVLYLSLLVAGGLVYHGCPRVSFEDSPRIAAEDKIPAPKQLAAPREDVVIDGPAELAVNQNATFTVNGLAAADLKKAKAICWPRVGVTIIPAKTWEDSPFVWFAAGKSGTYLIQVIGVGANSSLLYGEKVVAVGVGPDPGPGPIPPDPAPTPVGWLWVVVVDDPARRTTEQDRVMADLPLWAQIGADGNKVAAMLVSDPQVAARGYDAGVQQAGGAPAVLLISPEVKLLTAVKLPASGQAVLDLVKKWRQKRG